MASRLSQFVKLSGLGRTQLRNFANAAKSDASSAYHHELQHTREHAKKATNTWRLISLYVAAPVVVLATYNAYRLAKEHEEHMAHHPPEYKPWPHLRLRKKSFPWGDGDHTLFHNPSINMDPPQ